MNFSNYMNDTIAAVATPPGRGAISVIRISGKDAFQTVIPFFRQRKRKKSTIHNLRATEMLSPLKKEEVKIDEICDKNRLFGLIVDNDRIIDEVILSIYKKPHSYTGEDVVEMSCHSNPFIIKEIMQLLLRKVRLANPGEFTQRAFFNNKIDLTQAEAVGDLLNARTTVSHQAALSQLEGSLYRRINRLLAEIIKYRIDLELEIDFNEYEIPEINLQNLIKGLQYLQQKMQKLIQSGKDGTIIRDGLVVALAGAPNVGKSSLFNRLLETERAIVTPTPGTTRDYLEEALSIDGYLVRLIDTAGLRNKAEDVEAIGIGISYEIINKADKVLYLEDGQQDTHLIDIAEPKLIRILNKADIHSQETIDSYQLNGYLPLSATTGIGITELKQRLVAEINLDKKDIDEGILTNIRQIKAVESSYEAIDRCLLSLQNGLGFEFSAFDLKTASEALEEVIGRVTDDDLLNKIFNDFCVGK